jgi:hypothetical protein
LRNIFTRKNLKSGTKVKVFDRSTTKILKLCKGRHFNNLLEPTKAIKEIKIVFRKMGETSFEPLKDEYDETKTFKNIC